MLRRIQTVAPTGLLILLAAGCAGGAGAATPSAPTTAGVSPSTTATPTPSTAAGTPTTPTTPATTSATRSTAQPRAAGETAEVEHVVDGDTIDVRTTSGSTARIRLIGIDTPERGECNFAPASYNLKRLVLGKVVVLTTAGPSKDATDRYSRWLRYVDVGGVDAGLAQITAGLAIACYDSRDGYGWHPREDRYIAAQQAATPRSCGLTSTATAASTPTPAPDGGAVDYGSCRAAKEAGAVPPGGYRRGRDVEYDFYRDADHDGYVCE